MFLQSFSDVLKNTLKDQLEGRYASRMIGDVEKIYVNNIEYKIALK